MVTNKRKERVCNENKALLEIVWLLGKGVMFKKHIEAYMERFFAEKPKDTWEKVKRLEEAEVVQRIRLHNVIVIKLKKYALRFLLEVDRERICSIDVTASKLMRSAYVNAVILHHLKEVNPLQNYDYQKFLERYYPSSTFFTQRNRAYEVLQRYALKGVMQEDVIDEVTRLREIQQRGTMFKKKEEENEEENEKVEYMFNINSMEQGSVFLDYARKKDGLQIHIAILDDKNSLSGSKIAEKVMQTYSYLQQFFPHGSIFNFTVYVRNESRLKALKGISNTKAYHNFIGTKSRIQGIAFAPQYCEIEYMNLNLEKEVFGQQSLILSGNFHSRKQKNFEQNLFVLGEKRSSKVEPS